MEAATQTSGIEEVSATPGSTAKLIREVVNILSDSMRYGIGTSNLPMLLSMLAKFNIPMFLGSRYPEKIERRIHLLPNPIERCFGSVGPPGPAP